MQERDGLRDVCIRQGYVPPKCQLPGVMVWGLVNQGKDPCVGCNLDRFECGGRDYQHYRKFGGI